MTGTRLFGKRPGKAPYLCSSDIGSASRLAASAFYMQALKLSSATS